jgi:hypothetical protein
LGKEIIGKRGNVPIQIRKNLTQFAKWLGKTVAENLVATFMVSSSALVVLASLLTSVSQWLRWLFTLPPAQWPILFIAIVLLALFLLYATVTILVQRLFQSTRPKFIWVEHAGFKWKAWKQKQDVEWMPFCLDCQVQLVKPEYHDIAFCPICNKQTNMEYEYHRALFDGAKNKAVAILQKHSRFN